MAVPNYTYLKLKMPGPKGVITIGSLFEHAYECDVECVEHAEAQAEDEALAATLDKLASEVGLLMGRIIFGVFGLGCYVEVFGWELMGLQDKWVGMECVC